MLKIYFSVFKYTLSVDKFRRWKISSAKNFHLHLQKILSLKTDEYLLFTDEVFYRDIEIRYWNNVRFLEKIMVETQKNTKNEQISTFLSVSIYPLTFFIGFFSFFFNRRQMMRKWKELEEGWRIRYHSLFAEIIFLLKSISLLPIYQQIIIGWQYIASKQPLAAGYLHWGRKRTARSETLETSFCLSKISFLKQFFYICFSTVLPYISKSRSHSSLSI